MRNLSLNNTALRISLAVVLFGCAGQVPPDGGPIDREPPRIISTYPAPYTTQFHDNRIALEFDEYVDRRSVQESIFISPYVGELEFDWSGREVEVSFPEQLRENRTYVVNIGTDVVDIHNRNRMAQAFTLAFTTGDVIDKGAIEGRVYPAQPKDEPAGVMVFAYLLVPGAPDTLNPKTTTPDYITQTGKGGEFALKHIIIGNYRLLAVRDEFRNLVYDPESDDYGVPAADVQLSFSDTMRSDVLMRLAKEDTTAPRLVKITSLDRAHLLVEFSEIIDTSSVRVQNITIQDTVAGARLAVKNVAPVLTKLTTMFVLTDSQANVQSYRLTVEDMHDLAGNGINPLAKNLTFESSNKPDTTRPNVSSFSLPDSTRGIELRPVFHITFSDFMDRPSVENACSLLDSLGVSHRYSHRWLTDMALEIAPAQSLKSKVWYSVKLDVPTMKNFNGTVGKEKSTRTFHFETIDVEELSSIEGGIIDQSGVDATGPLILIAENATAKEAKPTTIRLEKPGNFAMGNLPEGQYILRAFRDRNKNGKYDTGRPLPFEVSERFTVYRDTLKLRARWPLEGVVMELK